MLRESDSFIFYEEGTLTNVDAVIYIFKPTSQYPICLRGDDLELLVDWDSDFELVEEIFKNLESLGVLSLEVDFEDLISYIQGKPVYFLQTLSKYCSIDLLKLESLSEKLKWSDLRLLDSPICKVSDFVVDFPEFLLDFGEFLEEKQTVFFINSIGIFNFALSRFKALRTRLSIICSNFLIAETLPDVLEVFSSPKTLELVEAAFKGIFSGYYRFAVKSYTIQDLGVSGADEFLNKLSSAPLDSTTRNLLDLYQERVFKNHNVFRNFLIELEMFPNYEVSVKDLEAQFNYLPFNALTIRKDVGGHDHGLVYIDYDDGFTVETSSIITLSIYPRFGRL